MTQRLAFFIATIVLWCGAAIAQESPATSLDDVSVVDQVFDRSQGTLTFTIRNSSKSDLVAWIYAVTARMPSGHTVSTTQLDDHSTAHAFAFAPGLAARPVTTEQTFIRAGAERQFVRRLWGQSTTRSIPVPLAASVQLTAIVFADSRAFGTTDAITRIVRERQRQAQDTVAAVTALKASAKQSAADPAAQLRAAAAPLSKDAAEAVSRAATTLERQKDKSSRDRTLTQLIQLYELKQSVLSKPIVTQQ